MEWYNSSMLINPALLLLCIIAALIVMRKLSQKRSSGLQLPPGPRGLPIIGHLHLLGKLPHQSLSQLSKIHGPLMSLRLGSVPVLVASSPDMARQILQTHDLHFSNRMVPAAAANIFGEGMEIGFSPVNAYWKFMRQLLATELVGGKALRFFKPVRIEELRRFMRRLLAESTDANYKTNYKFSDAKLQIRPKLQELSSDIIMRMMMGKRFSELGGAQQTASIVPLIGQILEELAAFNVGDYIPWLASMDLQGGQRRSKKLAADLRAVFESIIQARRLVNTDGHPPKDYLDVLLQASTSSNMPIHIMEINMPIHIMEMILDIVTGGIETSAYTIEWALADLISNPEKMRKVQAEIDKVVGRERMIEEEDIEHLPFFLASVKETMRLHPVSPMLIPHRSNEACEILGFRILPNTHAYVNVWAIGRDPKVWENPTVFSPERFLEASQHVDVLGQHFELLPFGAGRRMCPGWRLGLLSMHMILATLLQGFEWSIPPSHHLDMSEHFNLALSLATPLAAYTTPRLPKELY